MSDNNENKPVESKTTDGNKTENNASEKKQSKWYTNRQLKDYGIFLLIIVLLMSIISLLVVANRNTWNKGLSEQIKTVLVKNDYKKVIVEQKPVVINSPLSTSCAAFNVEYEGCMKNEKAVIIKVSTLFGPVGAVYLYHENNITEFIDLTSSECVTEKQIKDLSGNMQIDYWKKRIPVILQNDMDSKEGEGK